jgi:serine/threonine protein kinase
MTSACPPDDQLLALATDDPGASAVRAHVEHCADCQMRVKLLRGEVAELRSLSGRRADSLPKTIVPGIAGARLPSGAVIDRYVIVGDLGSGGQADVYRVIDPDLRRDLVLKLSRRQSVNGDARRDSLVAEGRLLAALDHPGLVRIFDAGIHDSHPYLVLDHVPGRNLEQTFSGNRPSAREAARLIADVAQVVAYAHRRGVIHGDITPRNILIDSHGAARLIDFGLSKIEDAWSESGGPRGGTPDFLPPEILAAGDKPASPLAAGDVFGLGATLYWLLTGEAPFAAPTTGEAIERARRCDIDLDALDRAHVPRGIARACRQALAQDPNDRPAVEALADALERASRRWFTRRVAIATVAVALICAGLYFSMAEPGEHQLVEDSSVVQSIPAIEVFNPDGIRTLSNELPLQTGDRVAIWCDISQGHRATMLWFNAAGELKTLSPVREVFEKVDRHYYPARNRSIALEPPEGTDLIFFCRDGRITDDELQACFLVGTPLPRLPAQNWLNLRRHEVTVEGPLTGIPAEIVEVEEIMKKINRKLRKHFQGVTGVAFPHRAAEETE